MQIVAGRFRGLKLLSPAGMTSRPTLSRIRQALFNMLAPVLAHTEFLDLYAGAGSVGLEAFSQGADRVVLVESDPAVERILRQNALRLDPAQKCLELHAGDARLAVKKFLAQKRKFDLVFLDPPYGPESLSLWSQPGWLDSLLKPGGQVILQHAKRDLVPAAWAGCHLVKERVYGDTRLSFFQIEEKEKENI
jgi:16S rRNA (guanine(966)-N(2))-methyltransferase RsmD